jgi:3-oxoacyl-[acyl-carrier protein] reductase
MAEKNGDKRRFENKVVLVTGSSKGIGKATAMEFVEEGAKVVINYLKSLDKAQEALQQAESLKGTALIMPCDVSDEKQVKEMVRCVIERFGRIDILINNAGITKQSNLKDLSVEDFRTMLNTNLLGTFLCSKYVALEMMKQKSGKIINVASIRGLENCARKDMLDYSASKAAVINLTKSLAKELAQYGINVNAVAPGITKTDLALALSDEAKMKAVEGTLLKRMAMPEEIAKAILFLASDDADYIVGEVLVIDGGYNLTKL